MREPVNVKTKRKHVLCSIMVGLMFVIVLIMAIFLYKPANVQAASLTPPEYLTIGIKYGSSAVSSGTVTSTDPLLLGTLSGGLFEQVSDLGTQTSINFKCENDKIILSAPDGAALAEILPDATYILYPLRYDVAWPISFSGTSYRGGIILKPLAEGKTAVFNYIGTEQYLEGMLHAEMPQSAPLEALKAQAIAARNFACAKQNAHQADGFNLCASNHCQVYAGVAGEYLKTSQAVHETEGLIMYKDGVVIEAYYSKNAGGYTNNSEDVWTTAFSYLRAVKDPYEPSYPWTANFSLSDFSAKLQAAGFSTGSVKSVRIKSRSVSGSVLEMEVGGTGGTVILKKEQIRNVLGSGVIKSLKFGFDGSLQGSADSKGMALMGAQERAVAANEVYVLDGNGRSVKTALSDLTMFNGTGKVQYGSQTPPLSNGADNADISAGTVTFTGNGYGHGVGLSQDGAVEMAAGGRSFEEILKFYYTGVEIK